MARVRTARTVEEATPPRPRDHQRDRRRHRGAFRRAACGATRHARAARRRDLPPSRAELQLAGSARSHTHRCRPRRRARPLAGVDAHEQIGVVLLDQRVAAGIGNVVKSEACWVERINPFVRLDALDDAARRRLFARASALLVASVAQSRRTTVDGALAVYDRNGRPCPRCRTRVLMAPQGDGARPTYWCPRLPAQSRAITSRGVTSRGVTSRGVTSSGGRGSRVLREPSARRPRRGRCAGRSRRPWPPRRGSRPACFAA